MSELTPNSGVCPRFDLGIDYIPLYIASKSGIPDRTIVEEPNTLSVVKINRIRVF